MWFSDVHQMMLDVFPGDKSSTVEVAKLLTSTFPSCKAKRDTKGKKEIFYVGLGRKPCESDHQSMPGTAATAQDAVVLPVEVQLRLECSKNQTLTTKVHQLEQSNQKLTQRVHQLEQELQSSRQVASSTATSTIKDEFSLLLTEGGVMSRGPDSLEHLNSFSLADVIRDVRQLAPNLYTLFCDLGDTNRNARDEMLTTHEEIKALTSLCVLANARSQIIKGVQLFMSIMLIARAINKQVWCS